MTDVIVTLTMQERDNLVDALEHLALTGDDTYDDTKCLDKLRTAGPAQALYKDIIFVTGALAMYVEKSLLRAKDEQLETLEQVIDTVGRVHDWIVATAPPPEKMRND